MPKAKYDLSKLPKWAQTLIEQKQQEIEEKSLRLAQISLAHRVLLGREWFTVPGPNFNDDEKARYLWFLNREEPIRVCAIGKGDVLLVGRLSSGHD